MEYTTLGNTDIQISKLCVGCMSFGKAGTMHDWTLDETETEKVVKHALSLGINFFDTANGYSAGTSEEYLGRALKKNIARDKVVIASKVYFNPGRLSAGAIHREIDGTLKRLGTDYLDLYIIHRFDYDTPIEETMEALNDLVKAGKVRALGASAMYGYQFYNMQLAARDHGWAQFQAMENHYNLLYREDERELIPICKQMGVSLMPYSPLAAGHLTRPQWNTDTLRSQTDRVAMGKYDRTEEQDMQIVLRVQELAERCGVKMQQIALAWHWAKGVASPIIGATKARYLDDAVGALAVKLTAEDIAYLEEPYLPHRVVGAIDRNPADGVMLLDEKKITYCRRISFKKGQNLYPIRGIRSCPFLFSRRGIPTVILQFGYSRTQKIREVSKGGDHSPFWRWVSNRDASIPVDIGYPKGNGVALGRGIQRGQRPPWHTILLCKVWCVIPLLPADAGKGLASPSAVRADSG